MKERIELVDSLRGFSLFGILMANMLIFQYGLIGKDYIADLSFIDQCSYYFTKIFIESSFMPIFTFLFGYSLIKFVESIKRRQLKTRWILIRRAVGLIIIGSLHAKYIWDGDILLFYGGISFILLFFIYRKPKTLMAVASLVYIFLAIASYGMSYEIFDAQKIENYISEDKEIMGKGSYEAILHYRSEGELPINEENILATLVVIFIFAPVFSLPMFLIGMASAKLKIFSSPQKERLIYKKLLLLFPLGIAMKTFGQIESSFSEMLLLLGGPLLALGYIGAFALFYSSNVLTKYKDAFVAVGKLSLTNYLIQSIVCTFIFYGYGIGLYNELGVTLGILLAIVIYVMQMVFSSLYVHKYKKGPVETVLKLWTNLKFSSKSN